MGPIPSSLWHKIGIPTPPCSTLSKTIAIVPVTIGCKCALFLKWDHMSRWTTIRVWPQSNTHAIVCIYILSPRISSVFCSFFVFYMSSLLFVCIWYVFSFYFFVFCILYLARDHSNMSWFVWSHQLLPSSHATCDDDDHHHHGFDDNDDDYHGNGFDDNAWWWSSWLPIICWWR